MSYALRYYSAPITIQKKNIGQTLLEVFTEEERRNKEHMLCLVSHMRLFTYRPYRRGKNRCKYCGCKK